MEYEIYAKDQVTWGGRTYARFLLGGGGPEYGMLDYEGSWYKYSRDWFQPPTITPYMGTVTFENGNMILTPYKSETVDYQPIS